MSNDVSSSPENRMGHRSKRTNDDRMETIAKLGKLKKILNNDVINVLYESYYSLCLFLFLVSSSFFLLLKVTEREGERKKRTIKSKQERECVTRGRKEKEKEHFRHKRCCLREKKEILISLLWNFNSFLKWLYETIFHLPLFGNICY